MSSVSPTEHGGHNGHHDNGHYDVEKGMPMEGGAAMNRQMSVQLTAEQFEKLYLQPGGLGGKGDLAKRFANPTPLGLASFLLVLTPFSCELMGWAGTTTAGALTQVGAHYFIGGLGLTLAGIGEFIIGNTFPSLVFVVFGGFWFAFGFLLQPMQGIEAALGAASTNYNAGLAMYLIWWGVIVLIFLVAALRTNVVFVLLFLNLDIAFWLLVALYLRIPGAASNIGAITKAAGAFSFLTTVCGWYLLVALTWGSTGIPIPLPVGDLSGFMSKKDTKQA